MTSKKRKNMWLDITNNYSTQLDVSHLNLYLSSNKLDEGIKSQIENDLHRTGLRFCSKYMQVQLRRILYAFSALRTDIGYCQGLNIIGAIILNVMEGNELDSLKVMIYLVTEIIPCSYFDESLIGLKADICAFNKVLGLAMPTFGTHINKLRTDHEPPLTDMMTTSWLLTLFATSLPFNWVLHIWDLIFLEGSDILIQSSLAVWYFLESRILRIRNVEEFYAKVECFTKEIQRGELTTLDSFLRKIKYFGYINMYHLRKEIWKGFHVTLPSHLRTSRANKIAIDSKLRRQQKKVNCAEILDRQQSCVRLNTFNSSMHTIKYNIVQPMLERVFPRNITIMRLFYINKNWSHIKNCSYFNYKRYPIEIYVHLIDCILYNFNLTRYIPEYLTTCDIVNSNIKLLTCSYIQSPVNNESEHRFGSSLHYVRNLIEENSQILCNLSKKDRRVDETAGDDSITDIIGRLSNNQPSLIDRPNFHTELGDFNFTLSETTDKNNCSFHYINVL